MDIHLKDIDTRAPKSLGKGETKKKLQKILDDLDELQNVLYAESLRSVLIVIQGMDASGKDGLTRDVFGRMNPQGVLVTSFKAPSIEELSHDFLWRVHKHAPAKGMIQIFNRSHYEDVLITRVHRMIDDDKARRHMQHINHFEELLQDSGTLVLKFYLHISPERQQERLAERLKDPRKMWKYNEQDRVESKLWDKYIKYYEEVFEHCDKIPWHIIPADQNWYKSYQVAHILRDKLRELDMQYPGLKK